MTTTREPVTRSVRLVSYAAAALYAVTGILKLAGIPSVLEQFASWGYPSVLCYLVGAVEVLGALALLSPKTASIGAIALGAIMLGAIYTHLFRGLAPLALVPLALLIVLTYIGNRQLDTPRSSGSRWQVPPSTLSGSGA